MSETQQDRPANNVLSMLEDKWSQGRFLCVGLDPVISDDFDESLLFTRAGELLRQSRQIVDATYHVAAAYKPNSAFYEAEVGGYDLQAELISYVHEKAPDTPVIWDAKRGDIGKTNNGYRSAAERFHPQGMTLHPYMGGVALKPLLEDENRMAFILAKTSNDGAGEFQDLRLEDSGRALWQQVAHNVAHNAEWNQGAPMGIVVGATYPADIALAREIVGDDVTMLIPGVGTQGGDLEAAVRGARNSRDGGFLINVSSGISQPKGPDGKTKLAVSYENIKAAAEGFDEQIVRVL